MKVEDFIASLTTEPDYILVPEGVDLSEVEVLRVSRPDSYGYNYPDGIYFDRERSRFEELVTEVAE